MIISFLFSSYDNSVFEFKFWCIFGSFFSKTFLKSFSLFSTNIVLGLTISKINSFFSCCSFWCVIGVCILRSSSSSIIITYEVESENEEFLLKKKEFQNMYLRTIFQVGSIPLHFFRQMNSLQIFSNYVSNLLKSKCTPVNSLPRLQLDFTMIFSGVFLFVIFNFFNHAQCWCPNPSTIDTVNVAQYFKGTWYSSKHTCSFLLSNYSVLL